MTLSRPFRFASAALLAALCASTLPIYASAPKTRLSMDDAKTIALTKEPGSVKSGELEHEKGRWIYSFDIDHQAQTREVNVDANTGKVVEDSLDTPADEAREAAADSHKQHAKPM